MKIAIQMDPLASLNPKSDTTLLLAREAARRGHALWCYQPATLSYQNNKVTTPASPLSFSDAPVLKDPQTIDLAEMDVVLMRQDPPFDMAYITATYLLEKLPESTLVINNPGTVRNVPEKLFPTLFAEFAPPTLISADIEEIRRFRTTHREIIMKPLYGHGGNAVFHVGESGDNFNALLEHFFHQSNLPLIVQPFLPQVRTHETRITFIDGKLMGAMRRIPPEGEIRVNMRIGGTAEKTELTPHQQALCDALSVELRIRGIMLAGVDMIGDYFIEANVTSPTGLIAMNGLYGLQLERNFWDAVEQQLNEPI